MKCIFSLVLFFSAGAHAVCVRDSQANLRKGPGANYQVSWVVGKYMPFLDVERKGNWIKVKDVDGEIHWAHGSILTRSIACVVVKTSFAPLRTGPGNKYPKASFWIADKYTPYKKISETDSWVQIENAQSVKFWVSKKNIWEPLVVRNINF